MRALLVSSFIFILFKSNAQLNHIDSAAKLPDTIYMAGFSISDHDSIPEAKKIRNLDFLKNRVLNVINFNIINSAIEEINGFGDNVYFLYGKLINNGRLKKITNLNKMTYSKLLEISYNPFIDTLKLDFDSLSVGGGVRIYGNQSLKSIDLTYNKLHIDSFTNFAYKEYYFGFQIYNNDSLRDIRIKTKNRIITHFDANSNPLLISVYINKLNYDYKKTFNKKDVMSWYLDFLKSSSSLKMFNNPKLKYFGGFGVDSFTMSYCNIQKNPSLSNLCILKNYLNNFNLADINIKDYFIIDSNGIGASSLEEVKTSKCDTSLSALNTITNAVVIFPNPVSDFVTVKLEEHHLKKENCLLYDQLGKAYPITWEDRRIDMRTFASGVYYLKLKVSERDYKNWKIIKQ